MRNADRISINFNRTIFDALKKLEETKEQILICIDKDKLLKGVINDGDIRRALLKGASVTEKVEQYMQKNPLFVTTQCAFEDAMKYITSRVKILPVVDSSKKIKGYYSFKEKEEFVNIKKLHVTVIGMGYAGLTLAIVLSDVGFQVSGYDIDKKLINALKKGRAHFYERGLQKYMGYLVGRNIEFISDIGKGRADVYIITVGTPIKKPSMNPNTEMLRKALTDVGNILENNNLVILRSTVPIEFCRQDAMPILEKLSGLETGKNFFLSYAPERTSEGQALSELCVNPQIIGGYDQKSAELTSQLFSSMTPSVIDVGSLEAAEMCKLIDNTYRDHMFAFTNQLVPLAEKLGVDLCKIVDSVNLNYRRNAIPKPSPGVGGSCLSKDPYILCDVFKRYGCDFSLIRTARRINEEGPKRIKRKLSALLKSVGKDIKRSKLFLIGLAFKGNPETSDTRESTSLWFLNMLPKKARIYAYDPVVTPYEISKLGIKAVTLKEGFEDADAVIFLNNHHSYQDINIFEMTKLMKKPAVFIDTWHIFPPLDIKRIDGVVYGGVGND